MLTHAEIPPSQSARLDRTEPTDDRSATRGPSTRERDPGWGFELGVGPGAFSTRSLAPDPTSLQQARTFVRDLLDGWGLLAYADDVELIAGELVSNAVRHATRPARHGVTEPWTACLGLARQEGTVVCAVADPSPDVPVLRCADGFVESGRGLHIVEALSRSWGWSEPASTGKTVWARVPVAHP